MGFGLGFDAPPRRGPFSVTSDGTWEVVPFSISPASLSLLRVVTPSDAPPRVELDQLTTRDARWEHAKRLVTRRVVSDPHRLYAHRSEVGDARDLFCHVLAHSFSRSDRSVIDMIEGSEAALPDVKYFVHVGDTGFALAMLRRMTSGTVPGSPSERWFNGDLKTLDGDGYVWLCVRRRDGGASHLMLVGGSGYGTHHAVTEFLRAYLRAEWLFPGAAGEVIERRSVLDTQAPVRHIDEPTVRSRAHGLFLDGSLTPAQANPAADVGNFVVSAAEADEMRTWLLRNRMRSNNLRPMLVYALAPSGAGWPENYECQRATDEDSEAFYLALLRSEERVHSHHNLAQHLSPFATSLAPSDPTVSRMDDPAAVRCYPDMRLRDTLLSAPAWLPSGSGELRDREIVTVSHDLEGERYCGPAGRSYHQLLPGQSRPQAVQIQPLVWPLDRAPSEALVDYVEKVNSRITRYLFTTVRYETVVDRRRFWRFIPSTLVARIDGPNWVEDGWHPCIFHFGMSAPSRGLFAVHAEMAQDIGVQVEADMSNASMRAFGAGDASHSIAHNDGSLWCNCDACTLADDSGRTPADGNIEADPLLLRCGEVISSARTAFERDAITLSGGEYLPLAPWEPSVAGEQHREMTLDELCMRGVVYHNGYLQKYSRRVIALAAAVSGRLAERFGEDPDQLAQSRVLTTLAYNDHAAAPIFSGPLAPLGDAPLKPDLDLPRQFPDKPSPVTAFVVPSFQPMQASLSNPLVKRLPPAKTPRIVTKDLSALADGATGGTNKSGGDSPGSSPTKGPLPGVDSGSRSPGVVTPDPTRAEQLPPVVVVYIAESRDTQEYEHDYPEVVPGTVAFAAERMRDFPQQFNHERWSVAATRTGMYEYIQARQFVVPRIYTAKLQRAVKNAVDRFHLRGFVSEACGAAGVTGPMLWELARVLWNPDEPLADMRDVWCRAAFGPAARAMKDYFDMAEQAWRDTRDGEPDYARPGTTKPDRRIHGGEGDGFFGQGFVGRVAQISQFAGLMRVSSDGRTRVHERLWAKLNEAVGVAGLTPDQLERVQLFRRTFGFTELVARWYEPLYDAFEMIRKANRASVSHAYIEGVANLKNLVVYDSMNVMTPMRRTYTEAFDAALDPDAVTKVRACIGTPGASGIRQLRLLVHQYFAQQDLAFDWNRTIPSLRSRTASDLAAVGFGLFAGLEQVGRLSDFRFGAPISENAHRQVGLYAADVLRYAAWWNSTFEHAIDDETHEANIQRPHDLVVFDWLFKEIKKMARAVAIYSTGVINSELGSGFTNPDVAQSIDGG